MQLYATILAGGSGTRFWPKSRANFPKQFLVLQGTHSLLQATVKRITPFIPPERIQIVTAVHLLPQTTAQLPTLPAAHILSEPMGRNTAAAIGLAARHLVTADPEAMMVVLPADHTISDETAFCASLQQAAEAAQQQQGLMTLGVRPTYAATSYGYIELGGPWSAAGEARQVAAFTEKPAADLAARFVASGNYLWNCGIFVWQASTILEEIARYLPDLYQGLDRYMAALQARASADELARQYAQLPNISIDYGVLEKSERVGVLPVDFAWNDVGSWRALADLHAADPAGNVVVGQHLGHDTTGTIVYSPETLVATVGVHDLIIVCAGDVLLVCAKDRDQEVREIVQLLRQRGQTDAL